MKAKRPYLAIKAIVLYLIFGGIWILVFDYLIRSNSFASNYLLSIKPYQDLIFIFISAVIVGVGFSHELRMRKKAEQNYQNIINFAAGGIFRSTLDGHFVSVNPTMAQLYGYSSAEEMIEQVNDIGNQLYLDPEFHSQLIQHMLAGEPLERIECQCRRKDGSSFWTETSARLVRDENGNPVCIEGFVSDITQRKNAEAALRETERQYRSLVEQVPAAVYTDAPENNLNSGIYISPQIEIISGYTPEEWAKTRAFWPNHIHPEDIQFYIDENNRTNLTGEPFDIEYRIIAKDGRVVWVRDLAKLTHDEKGKPIYWQGILLDITEKKLTENRIEASEDQYRQLVEHSPYAIAVHSNGLLVYLNQAGVKLIGANKAEDIYGTPIMNFIHPASRSTVAKRLNELSVGNEVSPFEEKFLRLDGSTVDVEVTAYPFTYQSKPAVQVVIRDLTEQKQAQESIKSNEEKLRAIIDNTQNIYYSHTPDHILTYISEQVRTILGYAPEEVLIDWKSLITDHPVNQRGIMLTQKAIDTGEPQEPYVLELKAKDGHSVWMDVRETPVVRDGKTITIVGALTDISQRKEAEERMERQVAELTVIYAVSMAGSQSDNENDVIEKTTQIIGGMLYPDNCGILLLNPEGTLLRPHRSYRGAPRESIEKAYPLSKGVTGRVAASGRPIRTGNVLTEPAYIETNPEICSELCVPIRVKERIIGVLNAESRKSDAFDEEDERLMNTVAGVLGTSIERIRLFRMEQKQRWNAENLREATAALTITMKLPDLYENILSALEKIVSYDSASIVLEKDGEMEIVAGRGFPDGVNMVGRRLPASGKWEDIRLSQHPLILEDAQTDAKFQSWPETSYIHGWMGIPMIVEDTVLGFLNVDNRTANIYTEEDASLTQTFANQAAIAIKNAFLYKSEQRRHQEAEKLRQAATAVTSSLDLKEVLSLLLSALNDVVPFDSASIIMPDGENVKIVAAQGFPEELHIIDSVYPMGNKLLKQVLDTGQSLILEDAINDERFQKWNPVPIRGWMGIPMIARGRVIGFITLDSLTPGSFTPGAAELAQSFAHQASVAIENARLFESLKKTNLDLSLAYDTTLEGWGKALELRDKETQGHTLRVTNLTLKLARLMGCTSEQLVQIRRGALVHDIGKMGVPDHILHKNGPLTKKEWEEMRKHPQHAFDLLYPIEYLRPALDIAYCHHEWWDGSGYPRGLRETQIPLAARIFAVVDVWDALLYERPYRKNGWPKKKIIKYLQEQAGIHFDPDVVNIFVQMILNEQKK